MLKECNGGFFITKPFEIQDLTDEVDKILKERKKILIAEDNPMVSELLKVNLEARGYLVVAAADGNEAIEKIRSEKPDLLILDIIMPEMDGWEVCKAIRDSSELKNIKIIILTVKNHGKDRMIGLDILKADRYLTKPFDIDLLLSNIKELLNE